MHTNFPWSLSHAAQSSSLVHGTVHRLRRSASSGSSSLMHLPTMQSMSDSHRKPSRPGRQMRGLPAPDSLLKQKWFGGQRSCASQLGTQMSGGNAAASTSLG